MIRRYLTQLAALAALATATTAVAQDSEELAKKLANPIANMASVPFQYNYNSGYEPEDGHQSYVNIQPVLPFSLNNDWNLISRTIFPVISQDGVIPGKGSQFGTGATTQSFFFSPKAPTSGGLIWGVGPAFLLPTATDGLATNQWGVGVTGVGLTQTGPWTIGALANHLWSITGNSEHGQISNTFLQPFVAYTTPKATSFTLNTESTYDWESDEWSVPINAMVGQIVHFGSQPVQLQGGVRYWATSPDGGPKDWGARLAMTFLFAK